FSFFFTPTSTCEISPLSLHDALPILAAARDATGAGLDQHFQPAFGGIPHVSRRLRIRARAGFRRRTGLADRAESAAARNACMSPDRKSTRLNSSHVKISYAVFCLKKK